MGLNKLKKVVFRTIGGEGIGLGHYYRCLSLARAMLYIDNNLQIIFVINDLLKAVAQKSSLFFIIDNDVTSDISSIEQLNPELIIFDSYLSNNNYLEMLANKSKLVIFDDNNIYNSLVADVIINGNVYANSISYKKRADAKYLLGKDFLVMREEYWNSKLNFDMISNNKKDTVSNSYNILVTTGGSDPYNISEEFLKAIMCRNYKIKVVIGPNYSTDLVQRLETLDKTEENIKLIYMPNSLRELIINSDIVITAGGSTVYEVISQNRIPLVFSMANNQDLLCNELRNIGITYLGKYPHINYNKVINEINEFYINGAKLLLNNKLFTEIDGNGALRVAEILLNLN